MDGNTLAGEDHLDGTRHKFCSSRESCSGAAARRLRAGVVSARVVGQVPVGVVGMKQRLVQQVADVDVGGGVVDEGAFPAALDQPGQPQLRQVLGHRGRRGTDQFSQAGEHAHGPGGAGAVREGAADLHR